MSTLDGGGAEPGLQGAQGQVVLGVEQGDGQVSEPAQGAGAHVGVVQDVGVGGAGSVPGGVVGGQEVAGGAQAAGGRSR